MLWKIAQFYQEEDSSIVIEGIKGNLKLATFFLLDVFLLACMYFLLFVRVKFSRKRNNKEALNYP